MATSRFSRHLTWRRGLVFIGVLAVAGIIAGLGQFTSSRANAQSDDEEASAKNDANGQTAQALPAGDADDWYTLKPMSFDLNVSASGELAAKDQVEVKSKVGGKPAIIKIVDEGTYVHKGQLLVKLDSDDIEEKVEQEQLKVENARSEKVAAEQDLAIEKSEASSDKQAAEVEYNQAKLKLQMWSKGERVQKRRKLDLALEKAKREVKQTTRDLKLSQKLYKQKFISLNELEEDQIAKIEAKNDLATAKLDIEVWNKYQSAKNRQEYQSDVDQAKSELQRTIDKNQNKIAQLQAELGAKKRKLNLRESRLADKQNQLENTTIKAPKAGLVVYASSVGRRYRRRDPIAEGTQVRYNQTVILLPDTNRMVAELMVHESLISQIKVDQKTTVKIESRPNRPVIGQVISKGVTPKNGGWLNPNLREYKVRVELPKAIENLKPAMRCRGKIQTGQVDKQLAVPIQAVFSEGRNRYCYVPAGEGHVQREEVKIGRASDTRVVVKDGLSAGDHVLLRPPKPGEALNSVS